MLLTFASYFILDCLWSVFFTSKKQMTPTNQGLNSATNYIAGEWTTKKTPSPIPLLLHDFITGMDHKENTSTATPLLRACPLPSSGCKQTLPLLTLLTYSVHVTLLPP
jgi:hypothetical protein